MTIRDAQIQFRTAKSAESGSNPIEPPPGLIALVVITPCGRRYQIDVEGAALRVRVSEGVIMTRAGSGNEVEIIQAEHGTTPVAFIPNVGFVGDSPESHEAAVRRVQEANKRGGRLS